MQLSTVTAPALDIKPRKRQILSINMTRMHACHHTHAHTHERSLITTSDLIDQQSKPLDTQHTAWQPDAVEYVPSEHRAQPDELLSPEHWSFQVSMTNNYDVHFKLEMMRHKIEYRILSLPHCESLQTNKNNRHGVYSQDSFVNHVVKISL